MYDGGVPNPWLVFFSSVKKKKEGNGASSPRANWVQQGLEMQAAPLSDVIA